MPVKPQPCLELWQDGQSFVIKMVNSLVELPKSFPTRVSGHSLHSIAAYQFLSLSTELFNIRLLSLTALYLLKTSLYFSHFDSFGAFETSFFYLFFLFVGFFNHKLSIRSRPKQEPYIQFDDADSNLLWFQTSMRNAFSTPTGFD